MGIINLINSLGESLRNFASTSTEFKCSQCIKCRQCIKTLSNEAQVRVFTCPVFDSNLCDDEYINSILPSVENGISLEYKDAYNQHRDELYKYIYNSGIIYSNSAIPLTSKNGLPIGTYNELQYFYKAMVCPSFRPFLDSSNILNDNDMLIENSFPELTEFDNLPPEDKMIITQRYDW